MLKKKEQAKRLLFFLPIFVGNDKLSPTDHGQPSIVHGLFTLHSHRTSSHLQWPCSHSRTEAKSSP